MGKVKQIEIKNRTCYFDNDIINIEEFYSSLLKIDKKSFKDIDIYYIGYIIIKKIGGCENIYSVNPLYLMIGKVDNHIECNCVVCHSIECNRAQLCWRQFHWRKKWEEIFGFLFYRWKQKSIKNVHRTLRWD